MNDPVYSRLAETINKHESDRKLRLPLAVQVTEAETVEQPSKWQPPKGRPLSCFASRDQTFSYPTSECRERLDMSSSARCGDSRNREMALLPAMALTAYARAEERARAFAAGFQSHVTRPVEPASRAAILNLPLPTFSCHAQPNS